MPRPEAGPGEVVVSVQAAGICHSDAHYRAGHPSPRLLPVTPGHEVAGTITAVGAGVDAGRAGTRVAVHYVVSCRTCALCLGGAEQFCAEYQMIGNGRDGGYAEAIVVPDANAIAIPDELDVAHAAVMMCSTATSLHALRRGRLQPGETVAVYGAGGLGMSAIQLATALGAGRILAVDRDPERLAIAEALGATAVNADDASVRLRGEVDVALDLVGGDAVIPGALEALAPRGRLVLVGIGEAPVEISPYRQVIGPEAEVIGCNDHTRDEILEIIDLASDGHIDVGPVITATVALDAAAVNADLDRLDGYGPGIRTVIQP